MSVVICSRDRAELLAGALPAVLAATRSGDEVVVVDSASAGDDVADVGRQAGVQVLRCPRPGLSRARNAGWHAARHRVLVFTDDDCRPVPGFAAAAARALSNPAVGAVWGRVLSDGGEGLALSVTQDDQPRSYDGTGDLSATGHGAAMAFRREALEAIGGFDEALGAGGRYGSAEDKDAFWRVVQAGWQVREASDMAVTHVTWRGAHDSLRVMYRYGVGAGALAAKRRRMAGERQVAQEVWRHGLLPAARWGRRGRFLDGAGAAVRAAGVVSGALRAGRSPLVDGRLVDQA